jgi:branched-subunit amino acid ABC-type transport system permease component
VMNVINLSHGPIITLGMFGVYLLFTNLGVNPYLALIPVALLGLLLGVIIFQVAVRRIIDAPHLSSLLATFAVAMIIIGLGTAAFGTAPRNVDFSLGSLSIGPITIPITRIVAAAASVIVTAGLYAFLRLTRTGRYVRAVANNRSAAELVGVPSMRILALSFGIGTMLAALSGGLISTFFPFTMLAGGRYEVKSFLIGVLGGLGNPFGALVGGLILGVMEGLIPVFMTTTWVPVIEFVLFILILLFRPYGIFGKKE